ncbi:MAG: WecB/TagA/CpsF family glycosyltransferase [Firmicutes bacterium]|jgi:N-acetylglucosaminyldiphosphoundecaprenol N-acetyl-beta-D-mannosaminyltransferase|nr:WecB/TagA/CpsF family glycosyltransferase [Bacillota bacterium]HOB22619.1 WecB/TagA/CpsF family glycosyltransferase [Bacillota bacterium]HQD40758.1 WecB/TagA/CpsF family glycosyltransferase [Bacillota bacterium]
MGRVEILGVGIDPVDEEQALERCRTFIQGGGSHLVFTPNAEMIVRAQENAALRIALEKADLVVPDGSGVVWASRVLGRPLVSRVAGIDLFTALCRAAAGEGWRVYLLGGEPGVAQQAAENLAARYEGLVIAGTGHGYFTKEEEGSVLEEIKRAQPDILAVGLGSPKQELWLLEHQESLKVPLAMGIGGSFDVISGLKKRAPKLLGDMGLEWAWRLATEPSRLPRMMALPRFALKVLKARLGGGGNR